VSLGKRKEKVGSHVDTPAHHRSARPRARCRRPGYTCRLLARRSEAKPCASPPSTADRRDQRIELSAVDGWAGGRSPRGRRRRSIAPPVDRGADHSTDFRRHLLYPGGSNQTTGTKPSGDPRGKTRLYRHGRVGETRRQTSPPANLRGCVTKSGPRRLMVRSLISPVGGRGRLGHGTREGASKPCSASGRLRIDAIAARTSAGARPGGNARRSPSSSRSSSPSRARGDGAASQEKMRTRRGSRRRTAP